MRNVFLPHPYRVISSLGKGGIGEIYLAYHENLQKYVVVKKIKDHCMDLIDSRIEVDILKNLHHQYLPQVYDFLQIKDGIYTVMDYIPGHDLDYYCKRGVVFSEEQLLLWLHQLMEVLSYLHSRIPIVLHCDIKPANIMITDEGNICLIDFNISIDGESNKELIGLSSQFASPEQVKKAELIAQGNRGDRVTLDARSDLYSVGAVFYYLMTGICPDSRRKNFIELKELDHGYSEALENIITKAMQPGIHKRFRSAADMQAALDHMERWTSECLRRKQRRQIFGVSLFVCAVLAFSAFLYDTESSKYKKFVQTADRYVESVTAYDYSEPSENLTRLLREGIQILNKVEYQRYLKRDSMRHADVLYAAGSCALDLEEYEQASNFFREAVKANESAEIFRDLALAEAGNGDFVKAEIYLRKAQKTGLGGGDADLIMAEISLEKGEVDAAYQEAKKAVKNASSDIVSHAVNIFLQAADTSGNTKDAVLFLKDESENLPVTTRVYWLRSAAERALQINENEIAKECLEQIESSQIVLLEDLYNLDTAYERLGEWTKSLRILTEITDLYEDEYKACIRMAYVYYRMNNEKRAEDRSYTDVFRWYQKAEYIMQEKGFPVSEDEEMIQLQQIVSQLEELGWGNK